MSRFQEGCPLRMSDARGQGEVWLHASASRMWRRLVRVVVVVVVGP
jgi:hypothetical protein